jgi:hypothetical protein
MRMRALSLLLAAVLGAGAGPLAGCGGDRDALLPASRADALKAALDDVEQAVQGGDCEAAERAVTRARSELVEMPQSVDDRLVDRLREGVDRLDTLAPQECEQQAQETAPEPPAATTTTPETTATETAPTETTETAPTEPPDTAPTETGPSPTTTTEEAPAPGEGTGGAGAGAEG